jgi:glucose-6-phosphate 1-dehydrogenase
LLAVQGSELPGVEQLLALPFTKCNIDESAFTGLAARLKEIEESRHTSGNVLFYLSTQPSQYAPIAGGLGKAGLGKGNGWRRLVVGRCTPTRLSSTRLIRLFKTKCRTSWP